MKEKKKTNEIHTHLRASNHLRVASESDVTLLRRVLESLASLQIYPVEGSGRVEHISASESGGLDADRVALTSDGSRALNRLINTEAFKVYKTIKGEVSTEVAAELADAVSAAAGQKLTVRLVGSPVFRRNEKKPYVRRGFRPGFSGSAGSDSSDANQQQKRQTGAYVIVDGERVPVKISSAIHQLSKAQADDLRVDNAESGTSENDTRPPTKARVNPQKSSIAGQTGENDTDERL